MSRFADSTASAGPQAGLPANLPTTRSLATALVILTIQTPKQMKTLITRAGPGTKMVCLGNVEQIDTPYLTETTSGLTFAVDRFKEGIHFDGDEDQRLSKLCLFESTRGEGLRTLAEV